MRKGQRRRYGFPHQTSRFKHKGDDGVEYTVTTKYYVAVLRNPQQVFMEMVIEGPDGYRRELHGDSKIRPVMERIWLSHNGDPCHVCGHRRDLHGHPQTHFAFGPCKTPECECTGFKRPPRKEGSTA